MGVETLKRFGVVFVTVAIFGLAAATMSPANADDSSVWLCKPGQADNPCVGNVDGDDRMPDMSKVPLGYKVAENPPVDCFYLYPTQSNQPTPNADFSADKELKDVAVNQARQFSRVCDVYAPIYRQYTRASIGNVTPEVRELAYSDVVRAWDDYIANYNRGRGVFIIGHSQGAANLARLINEKIDKDDEVRDQIISAILPGANVYVPIGKTVGGQFKNVPECESAEQLGCVIAYSMYKNVPEPGSRFGRVATGLWENPNPRPDPARYEVMCVNPADVAGTGGTIDLLADLTLFSTGSEGSFIGSPGRYTTECMKQGDANWLNVSTTVPGDPRLDIASLVSTPEGDLHLGDINLPLDTLVGITKTQSEAYLARETVRKKRSAVASKLRAVQKKRKAKTVLLRKNGLKLKKATKSCRKAKRVGSDSRKACLRQKSLTRKSGSIRRQVKSLGKKVSSLKSQLRKIDRTL